MSVTIRLTVLQMLNGINYIAPKATMNKASGLILIAEERKSGWSHIKPVGDSAIRSLAGMEKEFEQARLDAANSKELAELEKIDRVRKGLIGKFKPSNEQPKLPNKRNFRLGGGGDAG